MARATPQKCLSYVGISGILYHIWEEAGQSCSLFASLDRKQLVSCIILTITGSDATLKIPLPSNAYQVLFKSNKTHLKQYLLIDESLLVSLL